MNSDSVDGEGKPPAGAGDAAVPKNSDRLEAGSGAPARARPPAPAFPARGVRRVPAPAMPPGPSRAVAKTESAPVSSMPVAPLQVDEPSATPHLAVSPLINADNAPLNTALAPPSPPSPHEASPQFVVKGATPPPVQPAASAPRTHRQPTAEVTSEARIRFFDSPMAKRLVARYSGVFALILIAHGALSVLLSHRPGGWIPLLVAELTGALLLPILRVVPWAEEDTSDLLWFVLLNLMFGPIVALIAYSLFSMARQDVNPGIMGCLIVAALSYGVYVAAQGTYSLTATMPFAQLNQLGIKLIGQLLLDWSGLLTLAGWYAASTFRKLNE